jgi:hypothetical protein
MKLDNSNRSYSKIIAGILIISVLSIFVALVIGYGDKSIYEQDGIQYAYTGIPSNSDKSNLCKGAGEYNDVPVAKCSEWLGPFESEKGSITYILQAFNKDSSKWDDIESDYILPLCLKDTADMNTDDLDMEVAGLRVLAIVRGGYTAVECTSEIEFKQKKKGEPADIAKAKIEWGDGTKQGDCSTHFVGWIDVDVADTEVIELHATQSPCGKDLKKNIYIKVCAKWTGCSQVSQQFKQILVHKNCIFGVPNSR